MLDKMISSSLTRHNAPTLGDGIAEILSELKKVREWQSAFAVASSEEDSPTDEQAQLTIGSADEEMFCLGMLYLFESEDNRDNEGIRLITNAANNGLAEAIKFMTVYNKTKYLHHQAAFNNQNVERKHLFEMLHQSMQGGIRFPIEKRYRYVQKFIANIVPTSCPLTIKQIATYLLLLAHVVFLSNEAPDDEKNAFMLVDLLDCGISESSESVTDKVYSLLDVRKENLALSLYNQFQTLSGNYASCIAKECRNLFREIGSRDDVFANIASTADIEILADVLSYSFQALDVKNLKKWKEENRDNIFDFYIDLGTNFRQSYGMSAKATCEQLLENVTGSFSKLVLKGCVNFYNIPDKDDDFTDISPQIFFAWNDFTRFCNDEILSFSERIEYYGRKLVFAVDSGCETDLAGYTYQLFERIDADFLSLSNLISTVFTNSFDDDDKRILLKEVDEKLESLMNVIIEMKCAIIDEYKRATVEDSEVNCQTLSIDT